MNVNDASTKPRNVFRIWYDLRDGRKEGRGFLTYNGVLCEYDSYEDADVEAERRNRDANRLRRAGIEFYRVMEFDPSGHSVPRPGTGRRNPAPARGRGNAAEPSRNAEDGPPPEWLAHVERYPGKTEDAGGGQKPEPKRNPYAGWAKKWNSPALRATQRNRPDPYAGANPWVDRGWGTCPWDEDMDNWS
jgi:hypothetical protein